MKKLRLIYRPSSLVEPYAYYHASLKLWEQNIGDLMEKAVFRTACVAFWEVYHPVIDKEREQEVDAYDVCAKLLNVSCNDLSDWQRTISGWDKEQWPFALYLEQFADIRQAELDAQKAGQQ